MTVPAVRIRTLNEAPLRAERRFVLLWMTSFRRARFNFALERAVEHAQALAKPLVVFEPLRVAYPFASERLHAFVLQGMADNATAFAKTPAHYFPYVEARPGEGSGLLAALAAQACVVVGDDWPGFFLPRMQAAAAERLDVRFEVVDSVGLFPMHATARVFTTAHSFRVHLQKALKPHLLERPKRDPLRGVELPRLRGWSGKVTARWPRASAAVMAATPEALARLPIDHSVRPVALRGGSAAGAARLTRFLSKALGDYASARDEPEVDGTSMLSPYLHFGHVSTHEVFDALARRERWTVQRLGQSIGGAKAGWWRLSPGAEAFVDQLVTWRELAFNFASHRPDELTSLDGLPTWATQTLAKHARDERPHLATFETLDAARTHDPLWNAAQRQLVRDGWFHNRLRMLWGKKIFEWSPSAEEALRRMDALMSRYSLDGRDPVSWASERWVLGQYDRAWGPERPIFGTVRYMSSEAMAKKVSVKRYLARYGRESGPRLRVKPSVRNAEQDTVNTTPYRK